MAHTPYSDAREALNKRVKRMEKNGFIFPSDILQNKTIEEMNELKGAALEAQAITNLEGKTKADFRYGYSGGITEEQVKDLLGIDDDKEDEDIDVDDEENEDEESQDNEDDKNEDEENGDNYDDYERDDSEYGDYEEEKWYDYSKNKDYEEDESNFSYAEEIVLDGFRNQFLQHGITPEILDMVNKFLHKAVSKFGLDAVNSGVFRAMTEIEFDRRAGYDVTFAATYLSNVLERIESEYEFQSGFYHHDSASYEMQDFINAFQDAVERHEDWSQVY